MEQDNQTITRCPLCGSETYTEFDRQVWRGYPLLNLVCSSCGLVYQGADSPARRADFYTSTYREVYQGTEEPTLKDLSVQKERAVHLAKFLQGCAVKSIRRHLDIGSSAGLFLKETGKLYGAQTAGIEPGKAYREFAQNAGIKVYADDAAMAAGEIQPFDLVSLIHVLEHLPDPVGYLSGLRRNHLSPDGSLLLEVPNLYCHDSIELAHLVSYSTQTLAETVRQAGYRVEKMIWHGVPRSNWLKLYILLLARPIPGETRPPVLPERNVLIKRQVGLKWRRFLERYFPGKAWLPIPINEDQR